MTRRAKADAGQLGLPLKAAGGDQDIEILSVGARIVRARFVRNLRARRYVLRVMPDGLARVTVPRGGTRADARTFLLRQLGWIERERYAAARADSVIWFRGQPCRLNVTATGEGRIVEFATERVAMSRDESPRAAACRHLRELARRELEPRLRELSAAHGLNVGRVTIRGQYTRWGSCAANAAISLNWRLVQMPDAVRDYILIHELMHLRQGGHGRRFWKLVETACPDHRDARGWLKEHGQELL